MTNFIKYKYRIQKDISKNSKCKFRSRTQEDESWSLETKKLDSDYLISLDTMGNHERDT